MQQQSLSDMTTLKEVRTDEDQLGDHAEQWEGWVEDNLLEISEYTEEDDPTPEETAWRIWYAEALQKKSEDPNSWPPVFVPQTRFELLSILRRPQNSLGKQILYERKQELLFTTSQFEQPNQSAALTGEAYHCSAS